MSWLLAILGAALLITGTLGNGVAPTGPSYTLFMGAVLFWIAILYRRIDALERRIR